MDRQHFPFSVLAPQNTYMRHPGVISGTIAGNLDLGTTVDAAASFISNGIAFTTFGPSAGEWKRNSPNYLGFSFTGADAGIHYGWMRIDVGTVLTTRTIMEVGYSSVIGQGVQVCVVPEPSSANGLTA